MNPRSFSLALLALFLLLPLLFVRPALTLGEFFRKKEEKTP